MDIRERINIFVNNDVQSLLKEANDEIQRLRIKLDSYELGESLEPGDEILTILRAARPSGFRLVYAGLPQDKKNAAHEFITRVIPEEAAKDRTIYDKVFDGLLEYSKDYQSNEILDIHD